MTDNKKLHRKAVVAQLAIGVCQDIEIFLPGYAPDIEQTDLAVSSSKLFPKRRLASCWCEKLDIEAAWKNFEFSGIEATLDPALSIFFRVNENGVELTIEPMHVTPCDAF
jgi:hypothetical protein